MRKVAPTWSTMSAARVTNASLMIVGTSVGAGMLGLPVETARGGFAYSAIFLVLNWAIMTLTAFLLIELLSHYKEKSNFVSLSERIVGSPLKTLTFIVYLCLFLSLTFAYLKGGGIFLSEVLGNVTPTQGCMLFLCLFVPLILLGSRYLGIANSLLTIAAMGSFLLLVFLGINQVDFGNLQARNLRFAALSFPIFITSFGFHNILPTLDRYVQNKRELQTSVLIGTTITLGIYLIWQLFIMSIVPLDGPNSLSSALQADQTAISPLKHYLSSPLVQLCAQTFYFTAMTTSFLGVGLGLIDFVLDSFKLNPKILNRSIVVFLIYFPALFVAMTNLRIFYLSLKYGSGLACCFLLVLLPIFLYAKLKKRIDSTHPVNPE